MKRTQTICAVVLFALAGVTVALSGCGRREGSSSPAPDGDRGAAPTAPTADLKVRLTEVTEEAGIAFVHEAGARGQMLNPETFGPGAGWFDYDGDGNIDLLLVNGNLLQGAPDPTSTSVLYRNLGNGRFRDVTDEAGIAVPFYGMGFISGDVDNDGDQDLFLYGVHRSVFFTNNGHGRFRDTTGDSGLAGLDGWVGAACFFDYDRDGKLDLFVGNYVEWKPELEEGLDCYFGSPKKKYCAVAHFDPTMPQLFRGLGDARFAETTRSAGFAELKGKVLGVATEDYDRDGDPDLFVANDSVPNFLLRNGGDGTFEDRGIASGFATDADGMALAGMGIDTAWAPNDGPLWVGIGNFSGEPTTLHVQEGVDYFIEKSFALGLGQTTTDKVTFGLLLYDHNLDGVLDLAVANGHVFDVEEVTRVPYRQAAQIFIGDAWERLVPAHFDSTGILSRPLLGRALAYADYDRDGDLDLVVTENQGAPHLLRNDLEPPRRHVRIDLRGTDSVRDGTGAEVTLRTRRPPSPSSEGGEWSVRRTRKAASSYLSQSERELTFGLARGEIPIEVEVAWPSGRREVFRDVPIGREWLLVEGTGRAASATQVTSDAATTSAESANSVVSRQRGVELFRQKRYTDAARALETAIELDPFDFVAHRFHLMAVSRAGDRNKVEARIREITRIFPSSNIIVSRFALILGEAGYAGLAERLYEVAAALSPRRTDVWMSLGNLLYDRGEFDEALERYRKVLSLRPDSLAALSNIGKIYAVRKQYPMALQYLGKAEALRPDYASVLSTLGGVLAEMGEYERGEEKLLAALEHASDDETLLTVHGNLGILYFRMRLREKAIAAFEQVLALDPSDRQARRVLERLKR